MKWVKQIKKVNPISQNKQNLKLILIKWVTPIKPEALQNMYK